MPLRLTRSASEVFGSVFSSWEPRGCYALLQQGFLNAGKAWIRGRFRAGESGEAETCTPKFWPARPEITILQRDNFRHVSGNA